MKPERRMLQTKKTHQLFWLRLPILWLLTLCISHAQVPNVYIDPSSSGLERFAANELRRYLYQLFGTLPSLKQIRELENIPPAGAIVLGTTQREVVIKSLRLSGDTNLKASQQLGEEDYWIKTVAQQGRARVDVIAGGSPIAVLYGAYRFVWHLGVRFYLDGDVLPNIRPANGIVLPYIDEFRSPIFELRGIVPFHDFPEGPDWWNLNEYLHVLAQLPKLGMNFIGLHTYPEGRPNAEPTVWIGLPEESGPGQQVRAAYPASYHNTLRGNWGYQPRKTSEFSLGAGQLFDRDDFGSEVMLGFCPEPSKPDQCKELFERTGRLLNQAFNFASRLGVRTCIGTETPLIIPKEVQERIKASGLDPASREARRKVYEGIFMRIMKAHPLDYYWLWTPESWTWQGNSETEFWEVLEDVGIAIEAARRVGAPFQFATCGWVLGPADDRSRLGNLLPQTVAVSSINRQVGMDPVDPAYGRIHGRAKWAIPWLEDDPALTIPQLWVGRVRKDAADARIYGCTGLMGIHWRTRIIGPNLAALAEAAWDQSGWNPVPYEKPNYPKRSGPRGGRTAVFSQAKIDGTEEVPVYQSVRYQLMGYELKATNGRWRVTLKFCEPYYDQPGKRVFGVKLQGRPIIDRLDIYERVGKNRPLDLTFETTVTNGWLTIEFVPIVEYPAIAGIVAEGPARSWKINCGGSAWKDYLPDWPDNWDPSRYAPSYDFYLDWAAHQFGTNVAEEVAEILSDLDCRLPRPSEWVDGPGGLRPDSRPWEQVISEYRFVDWLEALKPQVYGDANNQRFDYWLEVFRYLRAVAVLRCRWAELQKAMDETQQLASSHLKDAIRQKVLPAWEKLIDGWREVYKHLLATVSTTGELGTIANWEQHIRPFVIDRPQQQIERWLGEPLPSRWRLPSVYDGPTRLIVPSARTSYNPAEPLQLRFMVLSANMPKAVYAFWRKPGSPAFKPLPIEHVNRGVYRAVFPELATADEFVEFYLEVVTFDGERVRWPSSAPRLGHVMSRMPLPEHLYELSKGR